MCKLSLLVIIHLKKSNKMFRKSIVKQIFTNCLKQRTFCATTAIKPQICIVGAGPAGFYAAQHLSKKLPTAQIDIYERLPVPFGLVRFGVAPDHPEVKNVEHTFSKTAENKNIAFLGNINVGTDVSLQKLQNAYHVVLLTYGAEENKLLGIPGEEKTNVIPARKIVGWYNGAPWDKNLQIDLNGESAAIVGQGNVAIDVARILLSPVDELRHTDITQHALDQLCNSKVKKVHLVGRRGPLQAAFTIKELREMIKLKNCSSIWRKEDFEGVEDVVLDLPRPKKRLTELMLSTMKAQTGQSSDKQFIVKFLRSPLEFIGETKVQQLKLAVNTLRGHDYSTQIAIPTKATETISCDLGITSIGYKSVQIDQCIPFDDERGIAKNNCFKIDEGFYTSGWLATGPTGVIINTMSNAFATADVIINDLTKGLLKESKPGFVQIKHLIDEKNLQVVKWSDWLKIDKYEQDKGKVVGKPREKLLDIKEMLQIAS